jgi:dihydrofolate synthase/folylpolyglutamate synthase
VSEPSTRDERLARYREALVRSNSLIEPDHAEADMSLAAIHARARTRLDRLASFLDFLGDPHRRYPVVHVTGTSGKGSTSVAIASILGAAGKRVGLYTSPYLQVATEKLQIGGRLIDPILFADLTDDLLAKAAAWRNGPLSYAEFWLALAASAFAQSDVDYVVIEVGAGGRLDATNVVRPAVSVITSVGLDHTETLGPTIADIAWQKAGIIKPGAPVVTAVPEAEAAQTGSPLVRLLPDRDAAVVNESLESVHWRDRRGRDFPTGMPGRFQAINSALAVAAVEQLPDVVVSDDLIAAGLSMARLPGRFEVVQREPLVVLDGAHNPDKIAAFVRELPLLHGVEPGGKLMAVVGSLAAKNHEAIIAALANDVDALMLTSPQVLAKPSAHASALAEEARRSGFAGLIEIEPDPRRAFDRALDLAGPRDAVLVTGSLYLLGNLRGRWFPDDEIVVQRSPWPTAL